ncbi:MAG: c-type cytochrome [Acidobacteria bacterium]|nr:c-type cytochrome [Acidobacteriota bacterium]
MSSVARVAAVLVVPAAVFALLATAAPNPVKAAEAVRETQEAAAEIPENPIEATQESVRAGLRVYGRFCRSCHGINLDGRGQSPSPGTRPANLVDDEWVHGDSDGEIYNVIRQGVPPNYDMDAWEGRITDEEIWNVVNYLRFRASR